jgi:PilZ domain-containing protein
METPSQPSHNAVALIDRRSRRHQLRALGFVVEEVEDHKVWRKALVLDASTGGVRIQTGTPLLSGQFLEFVPPEGSEYTVSCRVIWAGELGSNNEGESGLKFLAPYSFKLPA